MYDLTWAANRVGDWWKLCTRAQLFSTVYERKLAEYGGKAALQANESLRDDLKWVVAASNHDKGAAEVWRRLKRAAKNMRVTSEEAFTPDLCRQIRACALARGHRWVQAELF